MAQPTLADVKLTIDHLLDKHQDTISQLAVGKTYLARLQQVRGEMEALPPALIQSKPLAQQLAEVDDRHDDHGAALWHLSECYRRLPDASAEARAAATFIQERLITRLGELQSSYADEAAKAKERKPLLKSAEAMLTALPVAGGGSAFSVASAFLAQGELLSELLSQRATQSAEQEGEADRSRAGHLRNTGLGLLNRFRGAVSDELEANPTLPRDLDARLFTFLDERIRGRASGKKKNDEKPES